LIATIISVPAVGALCGYLGHAFGLSLPKVGVVAGPFGCFVGIFAGIVIGFGVGAAVGLIISDGVGYLLSAMKGRNKIYAVVLFVIACVAIFGFYAQLGVMVSIACLVLGLFWFSMGEGKFIDLFSVVVTTIIVVAILRWALPKYAASDPARQGTKTEAVEEAK